MTETRPHPAPFNDAILDLAVEALVDLMPKRRRNLRVLDPFAGIGRVHDLRGRLEINGRGIDTLGVELEPEWAHQGDRPGLLGATFVGDATALPREWSRSFDAVVTSPCYGNRMADHHDAADKCKRCRGTGRIAPFGSECECPACKGIGLSHRRSYKHYLGRDPSPGSAAVMAWGDEYRDLHERAWREARRVLRPGGRFVLNVKNHVRGGEVVRVAQWHRRAVLDLGFVELWRWDLPLAGYGFGANRGARVATEQIYVFER